MTSMNRQESGIIYFLKSLVLGSQRGIKDVLILMIPQSVTLVAGFVTSILIARYLGPSELGKYALVLSFSGLAISLSDLGIGQTAIRYASKAFSVSDEEAQFSILRWAFRLRMVLVFIVSVIFFLLAPFLADSVWKVSGLAVLLQIGLLTGIFSAIASVPSIYFQSIRRFDRNAVVNTGQTLISFAGIVLLWLAGYWTVASVVIVTLVSTAIGGIVFLLIVPRGTVMEKQKSNQKFDLMNIFKKPGYVKSENEYDAIEPTQFAFYSVLATLIVMITMRLDVWLMGIYVHESQIGIYTVASRYTVPLVVILGAITTALWPRISTIHELSASIEMLKKTLKLSSIVACGALAYSIGMPFLTPYLFGTEYEASKLLGHILCFRYVFAILVCPLGVVGYSLGLVRVYWILNLLQLATVLLINVLLLPSLGAMAAAIALLANDVVGTVATGAVMYYRINKLKNINNSAAV